MTYKNLTSLTTADMIVTVAVVNRMAKRAVAQGLRNAEFIQYETTPDLIHKSLSKSVGK